MVVHGQVGCSDVL
jgi:hypothetical protein